MYSALYGVPVGGTAGLATPWYNDIKEYAERQGIKTDEGAYQAFFNGGLSFLTEGLFGKEYNPAARYGPGGFSFIKDAIDAPDGGKAILTMMGASTGVMADAATWAWPTISKIASATMNEDQNAQELTTMDFVDAFRSISTVNEATKAGIAAFYGDYYSRSGQRLAKVDGVDAFAIGVLGLTPDSVDKMYREMKHLKDIKDTKTSLENEYNKAIRNMLRSDNQTDRDLYLRRARIFAQSAGLNSTEKAQWIKKALQGQDIMVDKIDQEYRQQLGNQ
jgi:hypothetical protein